MSEIYDFTRIGVCPPQLTDEINDSTNIPITCLGVTVNDTDQVAVIMESPLTEAQQLVLENLVANHVCVPINDSSIPGQENDTTGIFESFAEMMLIYSEARLSNRDWVQIGDASSSDSGVVMPLDGVITKLTSHVERQNKGSDIKWLDLYVDDVCYNRVVEFGPNSTATNSLDTTHHIYYDDDIYDQRRVNLDVNIQFNAGQKIRLRCNTTGNSKLDDAVTCVWYKWRK